jgi:exopolyphosphatase/pppGpp-phosphohydrolase
MEIVLGRDAEPELAMSLPLGAGRLTRLFLPDDPPSRQIVAGAMAARAGMKALNVGSVDICPWALREGIILHYLQSFNQPFDLPLRPLNGSAYGQDVPGGRHVTLVTTSSGQA